ncbi:MAG TPA: hypothetical protein VGW75_10965 [Solirubrobacteraceae bacterium]|jgi:hypothetical protein|nr:hypothetical protein [Solirubrobacteraceae bacterium]
MAATAAGLLAMPASALAADSVSVTGGVLTYVSGTGTVDVVTVSDGNGHKHLLTDWRSPSGSPGAGCAWSGMATVECSGSTRASLSTLDGDDAVVVYSALPSAISGGAGNDTLTGGPAADAIDAGDGDDRVQARDGVADTVDCGPGIDVAQTDPVDVVVNCNDPLPLPVAPPAGDDPAAPPPAGDPGGQTATPPVTVPPIDLTLPPLGVIPVVVEAPAQIAVGPAGVVRLDLACSPTEAAGCTGTVYLDPAPRRRTGRPRALASRRGRFGRSGFDVAAGKRTRLSLRLSASGRRALGLPGRRRARMARRGRRVSAVVTVAQKGRKPAKSRVTLKH